MIIKAQKDVNPLLLRFGVALAISFAGFLFSRIRTKRLRPALPPPPSSSPRSSGSKAKVNSEDGTHASPSDPNFRDVNSSSSEAYEKPYLRIRVDQSSSSSSPNNHSGGDRDSLLLPEFNNLITDFNTTTTCDLTVSILKRNDGKLPAASNDSVRIHENLEREGYLREIHTLRSRVRSLKEKERYLELQLLKYHSLKEQVNAVTELQSRLKIHNVESKLLAVKIDTLQAENGRLRMQAGDYSKVVDELEDAKVKVRVLRRKLRTEAEHNREQILSLKQKVAGMQLQEQQQQQQEDVDYELKVIDPVVELKLQKLEDLENEMEDMKKCNSELQLENSELARKLGNAEIYASAVLNNPKIEELKSEAERLKEENISLSREVERLHSVRCADVEELVYLRWLNACLRYELRNYEPPTGKTVARDLSKSLSPRSEREAKRLILEYANTEEHVDQSASTVTDLDYDNWFSSNSSHHTDSIEADEVSVDHQSTLKPQKAKKKGVFTKFMKLVRGKHSRSSTMESTLMEEFDKKYSHDLPRRSLTAEIGNAAHRMDHPSRLRRALTEEMPRSESFVLEDVKDLSRLWRNTSSRTSTRSSLELNQTPMTSLSEVDAKDLDLSPGFSTYIHGRKDLRARGSSFTSPGESQTDRLSDLESRKSELAKYAEVLKDTSPWVVPKGHKKAASLA